jgi:hypothetical protein
MKILLFIICTIVLVLNTWLTNCDFCIMGGSTQGTITRIPLYLQIIILCLTDVMLFIVIYKNKWKIVTIPVLLISLFFYSLSAHVTMDKMMSEKYIDSWYGVSLNYVRSSPSDPIITCEYKYPFVSMTDDKGSEMKIYVGIYPYMLDPNSIMSNCR